MLTPQFQKQLETDIRDQLQLALGKLAKVEVIRGHTLLNDIRTKGMQAALDKWDELSEVQTHFVLVDFVDGHYQIQTGRHDGMTGLSSAVVRRETLLDRQRVGDMAASMVQRDFGVVGTLLELNGKNAKVAIKGGGLVESLEPWVQRGDVFSVVRISKEGGKERANPVEWAVLQVVELLPDGHVSCRYFCRYEDDRRLTGPAKSTEYRCVKLSTISGPVRVRLVDSTKLEFLSALRVEVSANGEFKGNIAKGTTIKGYFEAPGPYAGVAYVRVFAGSSPLVEFPVALVDDRTVVCWMAADKAAMDKGDIELRKDRWVRRCIEALSLTDQRLGELNAALTAEKALQLGRQHEETVAAELARLAEERGELEGMAAKQKMALDLAIGIQVTQALAKRQEHLTKYLDDLDKVIKDANSDETRELIATVKRAEHLEKQAEFDKAIELYESVLKARDSGDVKAHLDQLKGQWAIKSKEHAQARQFLYSTWPKLELAELRANLVKARESFKACQAAGDRLTPLKLQMANVQHATALAKELEVARKAADSEDNRATWKGMLQLANDLRVLQAEVTAWVAR